MNINVMSASQALPCYRSAMFSHEASVFPGEKFGADGDQATATAMQAIKDAAGEEERQRVAEKASKKAAFNAEYDVGERCCAVLCMLCMVVCCAVLCCAVLNCAVLCRAVTCCAVLCRAVLCCDVLCRAVPCCAVLCPSHRLSKKLL